MALHVTLPSEMGTCHLGESIAVNGVCLTVTTVLDRGFEADVSVETLSRTTLGSLARGNEVNVERALRLSDRLGGHLVSGHIDGIGLIRKKEPRQRSWLFEISADEKIMRYVVEKGSVAVDGISLTVNACRRDGFEVNIIPQTGKATTLLKRRVGDFVNIETDLIGKYLEKLLFLRSKSTSESRPAAGLTMEKLYQYGFGS